MDSLFSDKQYTKVKTSIRLGKRDNKPFSINIKDVNSRKVRSWDLKSFRPNIIPVLNSKRKNAIILYEKIKNTFLDNYHDIPRYIYIDGEFYVNIR